MNLDPRACLVACLLASASCTPAVPDPPPPEPDRITQFSVINALMVGRYDGVASIPEMLRQGDFGVGTLDHLDGELVLLDGEAYQVRGDGVVTRVPPDSSTPFVTVTFFRPDGEFPCPEVDGLGRLDARLDETLPQENSFVAVRVDGRFASITLRSVHRQEPPYRPLAEVAESQSVWSHADVEGTLVGIRCPAWAGGLNVPGYHWHFLSDDRKVGGHVLDCRVREGKVRYDVCRDWLVRLDDSPGFQRADLVKDQTVDLKRVESSRVGGGEPER